MKSELCTRELEIQKSNNKEKRLSLLEQEILFKQIILKMNILHISGIWSSRCGYIFVNLLGFSEML